MSLLRRRSNSSTGNSAENSDEEEGKSLLRDDNDFVDRSKYKIPTLHQQLLMRATPRGGGCAKVCLVVSALGVVVLTSIAITLGNDALYCGLLFAEEEEKKKMVDGLAGAVVLYAISGFFSFLMLWIRRSPHSYALKRAGSGSGRRPSSIQGGGTDTDSNNNHGL